MSPALARGLNILGLFGISGILVVAFGYQFVRGELPCPLCLLQRVCFVAAGVGLALNLAIGLRPSHYGVVVLSAVLGASVSIRQILLHIVPGTGSYGSPLFHVHFYTLALLAFSGMIAAAAVMLIADRQFAAPAAAAAAARPRGIGLAALALFAALTLANAGATVAECGLGMCPDNPTDYPLLKDLLAR